MRTLQYYEDLHHAIFVQPEYLYFFWSIFAVIAMELLKPVPHLLACSDYFCESGCPGQYEHRRFYPDSLWDGERCGICETACC